MKLIIIFAAIVAVSLAAPERERRSLGLWGGLGWGHGIGIAGPVAPGVAVAGPISPPVAVIGPVAGSTAVSGPAAAPTVIAGPSGTVVSPGGWGSHGVLLG